MAAVAAAVALSAASCGPVRPRPAPSEASYPAVPPPRTGPDNPLDRRATAPVPAGLAVSAVEFADADEGYALFQRCDQPHACQAALAVTLDGGGSWLNRPLPFTPQDRVQLMLGRGNLLILKAEPLGWYLSRDTGGTFEHRPLTPQPAETDLAGPRFVVRCPAPDGCAEPPVYEIGADGKATMLPTRPPVGAILSVQLGGDGRLWAAGQYTQKNTAGGVDELRVVVSTDKGHRWATAGTIRSSSGSRPETPLLAVSADGADVWLAGSGYGYRRQPDGRWVEVPAMKDATDVRSAIALGGGVLLLAGLRGASTVTGAKVVPDAPPEVFSVRAVDAGIVQGYLRHQTDTVWLCQCKGGDREWIRVAVGAP
jgi:hypothetical protein